MLYFNPKPNFLQLSKYFKFAYELDIMQQQHPDGYPIVIDWYDTDEKVEEIANNFGKITEKYDLIKHTDNLFFLCLCKLQEIEAIQYELHFQNAQRKRTKELASLLLAFKETPKQYYDGILLKTRLEGTAKVFDQTLIEWIGKTITNAVEKGTMSMADFQFDIREAFFDKTNTGLELNIEKLKTEATKTITSPDRQEKALQADFCFSLYKYLIAETDIKPNPDTLFSDRLLNFYFDLLALFQYIQPDNIQSDEKDYMGSLLKNRFKKLNPHYQGNKSK